MAAAERKGKITQNVAVDCVDSTESIPKLLDYFYNKNFSALNFYCNVIGQRPNVEYDYLHRLTPGHPLNTLPEHWDGVLPARYFEQFTYKTPWPKVISQMRHIGIADPVTDLLKSKHQWNLRMLHLLKGINISQAHKKFEKPNDDLIVCPDILVEAAKEAENDPDPQFNSSYNWYYSGHGNLQILNFIKESYLLHSELDRLYLSTFSFDNLNINYNHICTYNCEGYILETISVDNIFIALRLKYKFIILRIIEKDCRISGIELLREIESSVAYTSISFDPYHKYVLYVASLDEKLSIINLEMMKKKTVILKETENLVDNWNAVHGVDRYLYTAITRKCVKIIDKRTNNEAYTWDDPGTMSDESCNIFSIAHKCDDIPFIYLGTNHHLFLMDIRMNGKKPKCVQRWTHQMTCLPTHISVCKFESRKDLVCLSSQWYEDTCLIPNDSESFNEGTQCSGITMPFSPPNIEQTLYEARKNMQCFDLYNHIESRIYASLTGSVVYEYNEKYHLLTQTSLGDIYCHVLYPDHIDVEDDGIDRLNEWSKANEQTKVYEVSKCVNIAPLWRDLKKIPTEQVFGGGKLLRNEPVAYSEQEVLDTFENGQLDPGLLDVWITENDENDQSSLQINLHFSDSE